MSFFEELDSQLTEGVELHCLGGFVVTQLYGGVRATNDIDFVSAVPSESRAKVIALGGKNTPLCSKHGVYLEAVGVAQYPENYESRLVPMFEGVWTHLKLFALEANDLALSKLERNNERDREDVRQMAQAGHLSPEILHTRYHEELRLYLHGSVDSHDTTLQMWIDSNWLK